MNDLDSDSSSTNETTSNGEESSPTCYNYAKHSSSDWDGDPKTPHEENPFMDEKCPCKFCPKQKGDQPSARNINPDKEPKGNSRAEIIRKQQEELKYYLEKKEERVASPLAMADPDAE